jgi:multidrug efflux pump subunit AcrB
MVPLGSVERIHNITGPVMITRYNMYTAAPINGASLPGVRIGQVITNMELTAMSGWEATSEACKLLVRPIVMTSFAFILGVVPLVISTGAGAEMRRTLGVAVFAGMLGVTVFGIFLTPVFFYVIDRWTNRGVR